MVKVRLKPREIETLNEIAKSNRVASADLIDKVLCEVKAGESRFQGRDFRQVLIYAALNFQSRRYDIDSVCLVNPRLGIYLQEDLNNLCLKLAGAQLPRYSRR